MDPEQVDTVTADSLMADDLINVEGQFVEVDYTDDQTDVIVVFVKGEQDGIPFDPDAAVPIYMYPGVTIE